MKKTLKALSTTIISGLVISMVFSSTVFAKTTALGVTGNDTKAYEYNFDALKASATDYILNGKADPGAKLYSDFIARKATISSYYDDVRKAYIDASVVNAAAQTAQISGIPFNLDTYVSAPTTATTAVFPSKVTLDGNGNAVVTPVAVPVTASVATTSSNSRSVNSTISVTGVEVRSNSNYIRLNTTTPSSIQFGAIITPSTATNQAVNWTSSNPAVATVDSNGMVTGLSVGSASIIATSKDNVNVNGSLSLICMSDDASLSNLTIDGGSFRDPSTFNSATTQYYVGNSTSRITVTPTVNEPHASVKVNGLPVASGTASGEIILNGNESIVTVEVTAQDGTIKTYRLTFNWFG